MKIIAFICKMKILIAFNWLKDKSKTVDFRKIKPIGDSLSNY